jgi:gluconate 2-dehydrogenase gamma chain
MTNPESLSRRSFLQSTGSLTGAAYLRMLAPGLAAITQAACSAKDEGAAFEILGPDEARDFAAIAARILPTTDTPGATEAGVIHFIDKAFAAEMSDSLAFARTSLAELNDALGSEHGDAARLGDLGEDDQDAFLRTRETTGFFNLMWAMTIFGFFSMEKYGGNKDQVGWELIGFEGGHGPWQYPFGYYDAQVHGETHDGE